jgi:hypothetical protein
MVRCARESSLITSEGSGSTDCLTFGEFCVFATALSRQGSILQNLFSAEKFLH